jgi:hypothetical protein
MVWENLLTGEFGDADTLRECKEWAESEIESRCAAAGTASRS